MRRLRQVKAPPGGGGPSRRGWLRSALTWVWLAGLLAGCIRAAGSVAEPTAIERQLLGAYQQLDRELVWVSSVRGPGGEGPEADRLSEVDDLGTRALRMRLLQRFNEDDLRQLADWQCVAEGRSAAVQPVGCDEVERDLRWRRIRERVVQEENQAREVIIEYAADQAARRQGRSEPDDQLRQRMRAAYADLMRTAAAPDHLVESSEGALVPAAELSASEAASEPDRRGPIDDRGPADEE